MEPQNSHRFNSVDEIISDPVFNQSVIKIISDFKNKRKERPEPKPGTRYIRDWIDRMDANEMVNYSFFISNIKDVWLKKSKLNSEFRRIIKFVCDKALQQTLVHYATKPKE